MKTAKDIADKYGLDQEGERDILRFLEFQLKRRGVIGRPVIKLETCDLGHKFAKLQDHPIGVDGLARCPHCLAQGLEQARGEIAEGKKAGWVLSFVTNMKYRNNDQYADQEVTILYPEKERQHLIGKIKDLQRANNLRERNQQPPSYRDIRLLQVIGPELEWEEFEHYE